MLRQHQRDYASKMNLSYAALILLYYGCCLLQGVSGLRLLKVVIPSYKLRGEAALLECQYELNGRNVASGTNSGSSHHRGQNRQHQHYHQQQLPQDIYNNNHEELRLRGHHYSYDSIEQNDGSEALYSVKWYKDNEEFYRYVPKANPPQQSFRVDGIRVDHQHSDSSKVYLRGLTLKSTGLYRCEVSAEAPNFSSAQGEGRMDIVYLPKEGPHISGKEDQYQIGDTLSLNCTSGKSHPASHLQWFINDEPLGHSSFLVHYNDTVHTHGLITSMLGLQLVLDVRHFQDGAMRVKCVASVSPVLWKGGKESVVQRRPALIDNREAMLLVLSSSFRLQCSLILIVLAIFTIKFSQLVYSNSLSFL